MLTADLPLEEATKCASWCPWTARSKSNLSVGLPLDLAVYEVDRFSCNKLVCIDEHNPDFQSCAATGASACARPSTALRTRSGSVADQHRPAGDRTTRAPSRKSPLPKKNWCRAGGACAHHHPAHATLDLLARQTAFLLAPTACCLPCWWSAVLTSMRLTALVTMRATPSPATGRTWCSNWPTSPRPWCSAVGTTGVSGRALAGRFSQRYDRRPASPSGIWCAVLDSPLITAAATSLEMAKRTQLVGNVPPAKSAANATILAAGKSPGGCFKEQRSFTTWHPKVLQAMLRTVFVATDRTGIIRLHFTREKKPPSTIPCPTT